MRDGPLDMRMDERIPKSAADLLMSLSERELAAALEELAKQDIPTELKNGGSTIMVPESMVARLRIELAGTGVKVGSIAPGSTSSEMFDRMMAAAKVEAPVALDPQDVARAIRFMLEQPDRANIARLALYPQGEGH